MTKYSDFINHIKNSWTQKSYFLKFNLEIETGRFTIPQELLKASGSQHCTFNPVENEIYALFISLLRSSLVFQNSKSVLFTIACSVI